MPQSLKDRLRGAKKEWKEAEVQDFGAKLPQGAYQFEILPPTPGKSIICEDRDGAIRARLVIQVVSGPDEKAVGRKATKSWTLIDGENEPSEVGLSILKGELQRLGQETDFELDGIGEILGGLIGATVDANVANRVGNDGVERQNVYFNGLAEPPTTVPRKKKATKKTSPRPPAKKKTGSRQPGTR